MLTPRQIVEWPHFICCANITKKDDLVIIVNLLIEKGADANSKTNLGKNPLHMLCSYYKNDNLIDVVKYFITKGAKVYSITRDKKTPLHLLFHYKHDKLFELIQLLNPKKSTTSDPLDLFFWLHFWYNMYLFNYSIFEIHLK